MYSLLGQFWKVFRGYLAFFVTILVIWWAVTTDFTTYITMNVINARWLIIVILSSFFPITMVAYQIFQKEIRYERFLIDIDLLGIPIGEAEKNSSDNTGWPIICYKLSLQGCSQS